MEKRHKYSLGLLGSFAFLGGGQIRSPHHLLKKKKDESLKKSFFSQTEKKEEIKPYKRQKHQKHIVGRDVVNILDYSYDLN
jgi:hypothetical protein